MGNSSSTAGWRRTDTVRRFRERNELVTERLYTRSQLAGRPGAGPGRMRTEEEWREERREPHPDYLAEQARELYNEGRRLYNQGDYEGAAQQYQAARDRCPEGHANRTTYQQELVRANQQQARVEEAVHLNDEGRRLYEQGNYEGAAQQFQAARDRCPAGHANRSAYQGNLNLANEQARVAEASRLNDEGRRLYEQGDYEGAAQQFQAARDRCPAGHANRSTYQGNLNLANEQARVAETHRLYGEGRRLYAQGNYRGASRQFQEALDRCPGGHANRAIYRQQLVRANEQQARVVAAQEFYQQGQNMESQGNDEEAARQYQAAHDRCPEGHLDRNIYYESLSRMLTRIRSNINAQQNYARAAAQVSMGMVREAINTFEAVHAMSTSDNLRNRCTDGIRAANLAIEAEEMLNNNNFSAAGNRFQQAHDTTNIDALRASFAVSRDAANFAAAGLRFYAQGNYEGAAQQYQAALDRCPEGHANRAIYQQQLVRANEQQARVVAAQEFYQQGQNMERRGDYEGAAQRYQQALDRCPEGHANRAIYQQQLVRANEQQAQAQARLQEEEQQELRAETNLKRGESETELNQGVIKKPRIEEEHEKTIGSTEESDGSDEEGSIVFTSENELSEEESDEESRGRQNSTRGLEGQAHLEMGSASTVREPLVAMILETYSITGMDELLKLRLASLRETIQKPVKILPSSAISFRSSGLDDVNVRNILKQLAKESNVEDGVTILPLLISLPQVVGGYNIKHWVGLISHKSEERITISYFDSENMTIEGLSESLIAAYQEIHPNCRIDFRQVSNEQQRYNNCGPELIENIALYLTGIREKQEDVAYLHSSIWEQKLILDEIEATKKVRKEVANEGKQEVPGNEVYRSKGDCKDREEIGIGKRAQVMRSSIVQPNKYQKVKHLEQVEHNMLPQEINASKNTKTSKFQGEIDGLCESLAGEEEFLKEVQYFVAELPDVSEEFLEAKSNLEKFDFDDFDIEELYDEKGEVNTSHNNYSKLQELENIHKKMLKSFKKYTEKGKEYIKKRDKGAGEKEQSDATTQDEAYQFTVFPIQKGSNSFYLALADQLKKLGITNEKEKYYSHKKLKKLALDYIKATEEEENGKALLEKLKDVKANEVRGDLPAGIRTIGDYIVYHSKEESIADSGIILALAHALDITLRVYKDKSYSNQNVLLYNQDEKEERSIVTLLKVGQDYESLISMPKTAVLPFENEFPEQSYKLKRIFEIFNSRKRTEHIGKYFSRICKKLTLTQKSVDKLNKYFNASNIAKLPEGNTVEDNGYWYSDEDMNTYGKGLEKHGVDLNRQFSNRVTEDVVKTLPSRAALVENEPRYICYNIGGSATRDSGIHWVGIVLVKRQDKITILYKDPKGDWNGSSESVERAFRGHYKDGMNEDSVEFIKHIGMEQQDGSSCGPMTINNLEIIAKKVKEVNDVGQDGVSILVKEFADMQFTPQDDVLAIRLSHISLQGPQNNSGSKQEHKMRDLDAILRELQLINADNGNQHTEVESRKRNREDEEEGVGNIQQEAGRQPKKQRQEQAAEEDRVNSSEIKIDGLSHQQPMEEVEEGEGTEGRIGAAQSVAIDEKAKIAEYVHMIDRCYEETIDEAGKKIKEWGASEITKWARENKGKLSKNFGDSIETAEKICEAIAVMDRANELASNGHRLRDTQKVAAVIFMQTNDKGHISQINTGEGKTTIVSLIQALRVMQGYKGHVITSNNVLAAEGVKDKKLFYQLLGITSSHNNPDAEYTGGERGCYKADIVYGSITNFQFDWLRHSFEQMKTLGDTDYENIWVTLDEIDSLLIDQGGHIAKLSGPFPGMESLRYVYMNVWVELAKAEEEVTQEISKKLQDKAKELEERKYSDSNTTKTEAEFESEKQQEYEKYEDTLRESFLGQVKEKIKDKKDDLVNKKVIAAHLHQYAEDSIDRWIEYAFSAKYQYTENVEYKIAKGKEGEDIIIPVDNQNTGVSMQNTILSNGLHQFLQIKHNLALTYESLTSCYISNLDYVKKYGTRLSGVTGTLGSKAERELLGSVFNVNFSVMPPFKPKQFKRYAGKICQDEDFISDVAVAALGETIRTKIESVVEEKEGNEVAGQVKQDAPRSVLIVSASIADALKLEKEIRAEAKAAGLKPKIRIYNDETQAHVTEATVGVNEIIIATNIAGRGTDFKTTKELEENGGLHVIVAFLPCNKRVEDQALGRTARQGNEGTGQIIAKESEVRELGVNKGIKDISLERDVLPIRDMVERERIDDVKDNKFIELQFKGQLFNKFSAQYGGLKNKHETGPDVVRWIHVLKDLKEKWAFWLEKQTYTAEEIKKRLEQTRIELEEHKEENEGIESSVVKVASHEAVMQKFVESEYKRFLNSSGVSEIIDGHIRHNPFYSICLAEKYLEVSVDKTNRDKARAELENAIRISKSSELLYSAYVKFFELAVEDGGQVLQRYKDAIAKVFVIGHWIDTKDERYKTKALGNLEKAKEALEIEYSYLDELINGKKNVTGDASEPNDSILTQILRSSRQGADQASVEQDTEDSPDIDKMELDITASDKQQSGDSKQVIGKPSNPTLKDATSAKPKEEQETNLFVKHLQARFVALGAYKGNIESLIKQLEGKSEFETTEETVGTTDGIIMETRVPRYLSKLDSNNELKKLITERSVNELEYVGMSPVYQLKKIHDVPSTVIAGAQGQIAGAIVLLGSAAIFPFLLPVNGPLAGAMVSEGITDIITALIDQGNSALDKKDYVKGKIISYGITLATMGIGAILNSTKLLAKAMNACRSLATKLRAVKGPFAKICQTLANQLDKVAKYLEQAIAKIKFMKMTVAEQEKYLNRLVQGKQFEEFQKLQKVMKVSDITLSHGQRITQIVTSSAVGALKGVAISVAMEKIFTASLDRLMSNLRPIIEKKVREAVSTMLGTKEAQGVLNRLTEQDVNKAISQLFETSLGGDIEDVAKQIAFGVIRHCSNWKVQLATLALESLISGIDIANYTEKICNKLIVTLTNIVKPDAMEIGHEQKVIDGIINKITEPVSDILYGKIVAMTGKVAVTLPKALYRGYKEHQEKKSDERDVKAIKHKEDTIDTAYTKSEETDSNCVYKAIAETIGLDQAKDIKLLAGAANLAPSENGASVEDIKKIYKEAGGVDSTSYPINQDTNIGEHFDGQSLDRGVVCLGKEGQKGHAVPFTFAKDKGLMVTVEGGQIPLAQYQQKHGYTTAEVVILKGVNSDTTIQGIQRQVNRNRIVKATSKVSFVGQGAGQKFGNSQTNELNKAKLKWRAAKREGASEEEIQKLREEYHKEKNKVEELTKHAVTTPTCTDEERELRRKDKSYREQINSKKIEDIIKKQDTSITPITNKDKIDILNAINKLADRKTNTQKESSSVEITDNYHIDITSLPGNNNYLKIEVQGRKDKIGHNRTIAQVTYPRDCPSSPRIYDLLKSAVDYAAENKNTSTEYKIDSLPQKGLNLAKLPTMFGISASFYEYTMRGINNILRLRSRNSGLDNVVILPDRYIFGEEHHNIDKLLFALSLNSLEDQDRERVILAPISLNNEHAVGLMFVHQDVDSENVSTNRDTIHSADANFVRTQVYYIDPSNGPIPTSLQEILENNGYEVEQLPAEQQRYTNCGPEVIENFMLYLTGERLSQEAAIPYHSKLFENELLRQGNIEHHSDLEGQETNVAEVLARDGNFIGNEAIKAESNIIEGEHNGSRETGDSVSRSQYASSNSNAVLSVSKAKPTLNGLERLETQPASLGQESIGEASTEQKEEEFQEQSKRTSVNQERPIGKKEALTTDQAGHTALEALNGRQEEPTKDVPKIDTMASPSTPSKITVVSKTGTNHLVEGDTKELEVKSVIKDNGIAKKEVEDMEKTQTSSMEEAGEESGGAITGANWLKSEVAKGKTSQTTEANVSQEEGADRWGEDVWQKSSRSWNVASPETVETAERNKATKVESTNVMEQISLVSNKTDFVVPNSMPASSEVLTEETLKMNQKEEPGDIIGVRPEQGKVLTTSVLSTKHQKTSQALMDGVWEETKNSTTEETAPEVLEEVHLAEGELESMNAAWSQVKDRQSALQSSKTTDGAEVEKTKAENVPIEQPGEQHMDHLSRQQKAISQQTQPSNFEQEPLDPRYEAEKILMEESMKSKQQATASQPQQYPIRMAAVTISPNEIASGFKLFMKKWLTGESPCGDDIPTNTGWSSGTLELLQGVRLIPTDSMGRPIRDARDCMKAIESEFKALNGPLADQRLSPQLPSSSLLEGIELSDIGSPGWSWVQQFRDDVDLSGKGE